MRKQIYMAIYLALLAVIAITFYFQITTFKQGNPYQWHLLGVLVAVFIAYFFLKSRMEKENWFGKK